MHPITVNTTSINAAQTITSTEHGLETGDAVTYNAAEKVALIQHNLIQQLQLLLMTMVSQLTQSIHEEAYLSLDLRMEQHTLQLWLMQIILSLPPLVEMHLGEQH